MARSGTTRRRLSGVWLGAIGVIGGLLVPWSLAVALG